jgi:hypothetical protein
MRAAAAADMELALLRLATGPGARATAPSPGVVVDIFWASAIPDDRLEHVMARSGPSPTSVDIALFHSATGTHSADDLALCLARRALSTAPALAGWTVSPLSLPPNIMTWEIS